MLQNYFAKPSFLGSFPSSFDSNISNYLSRYKCCSIPDNYHNACFQAIIPFWVWACVSSNAFHIQLFQDQSGFGLPFSLKFWCHLSFHGEDCIITYFQSFSILSSNLSSQNDLPASLDDQLSASIFNFSTIRDQAHLHAVTHCFSVSSGWLKPIPQPSLGLTFFLHDFVVAVRLWLGIPLFSLLPFCTCLSVID